MTASFSVELAHLDGYALVVVVGEVDIATASEMERVLSKAVEDGTTDLVVDLAGCEFMDSSGIRVLLTANGTARRMTLRSPNAIVRRVCEALGLADTLTIEDAENV